jgi:phosphoglycerate dehydrogenase-like enzyme
MKILVLNDPTARYLRVLANLPENTDIVVGNSLEAFSNHLEDAAVIFAGMNTGELLQQVLPLTKRVRWIHSFSAGVEGLMSPEVLRSSMPLTNGRGVFARSLGEFVLASVLYFAKDLRRLVRNQAAGIWEQFDNEAVHGKTMGIIGYGEIGRAAAERAHAFGMRIIALRRRPELSAVDPLIEKVFTPEERLELLANSDYVVLSTPLTPATRGFIGEPELRAMKPGAVIINVGRGPVIVEKALIRALKENWIRGAALDVFDNEPLPADHPFYRLENVLLSPHSADHTATWLEDAMELFVDNFMRFAAGQPLRNVVDKTGGY